MNKILSALLALAFAIPVGSLSLNPATADYLPTRPVQGVGVAQSGVTSYNPILVRYVGPVTGGTPDGGNVAVDAGTGDITLTTGPVASATADLTTECPVSGALGGVIDVSDAACNTLGEVVDAFNASPNWRAVIQDGQRSDSSNNVLNTLAITSAALPQGLSLAGDGAVSLKSVIALVPVRNDIRFYLQGSGENQLNPNPFRNSQSEFLFGFFDQTNGAAAFRNLYSVALNNRKVGPAVAATPASIIGSASEIVTTLYSISSEGTTDFSENGIPGLFTTPGVPGGLGFVGGGEKLVFEGVGGAGYDTLVLLSASGRFYPASK